VRFFLKFELFEPLSLLLQIFEKQLLHFAALNFVLKLLNLLELLLNV